MSFELNGLAAEPISAGINKLFLAIAMGPMVKEKAQMQAGLMGAQQMKAQAEADASNYTLNNRKNIAQWLDNDPDIQALTQSNPHFANVLRVASKMYGQTGHHDISKLSGDFQRQALLGEARQAIPADSQDLELQNRLVSIASGRPYEPFKNISNTGYMANHATGQISLGNAETVDFFRQTQNAQNALRNAQAQKVLEEASSPLTQLKIENERARLADTQAKTAGRHKKAETTLREHTALHETNVKSLNRALGFLDRVLKNEEGLKGISGPQLSHKPTVLMTPAQSNAKSDLETIKSKVSLGVIQDMREGSAAGATGFGNMNERQTKLIEEALGSLDRAQSYEQVVGNLKIIQQAFQEIRNNSLQDMGRINLELLQFPAQKDGTRVSQTPRKIIRRGKLKDGRVVIQYSDGDTELK